MSAKEWMRIGLVGALLAVLVLAAGCASANSDAASEEADRGGEASPMPDDDVVLTAEDDGSVVELGEGQALVVTLESNPTTGYSWQVSEVDEDVLMQIGDPEFEEAAATEGEQVLGSGGTETFYFASAAGETTLTLVYHRPWEEDVEPEAVFSVEVIVR
ncbi:MAG: protease inhibitor I42 family protein [Anaerolineae bacterium]|jgi:inhibitor of cysteine peptidase